MNNSKKLDSFESVKLSDISLINGGLSLSNEELEFENELADSLAGSPSRKYDVGPSRKYDIGPSKHHDA